eukprot:11489945-Alexandrium_andersonii.AAC.1
MLTCQLLLACLARSTPPSYIPHILRPVHAQSPCTARAPACQYCRVPAIADGRMADWRVLLRVLATSKLPALEASPSIGRADYIL